MKILLTGRMGQIGWELRRTLAPLGEVIATGRAELDLGNPDTIRRCVRATRPDVVVNAAAYTGVDDAEAEEASARAINTVAPGVLAEEVDRLEALLIHYSTDYVFDGALERPYREDDPPDPLGVYGRTKLAGERAVSEATNRFVILRTSWIYGTRGRNFLRTILRLARERETLEIVHDQLGAPTWCRMVAETTAQILARRLPAKGARPAEGPTGLFHLAAAGTASWYDFARAIVANDPNHAEQMVREIRPIPSSEFPTPARRPLNCQLDCTALADAFGLRLPDWEAALRLAMTCE